MDSFVNSLYLERKTIACIKQQLISPKSIQLYHFLQQPIFRFLHSSLQKCSWHHEHAAHIHSFSTPSTIPLPIKTLLTVLDSDEWAMWLLLATGKEVKLKKQRLQLFGTGDYTLQHDIQERGIHCMIALTSIWGTNWGGYTSLVKEGKEIVRINPIPNSLTLFEQKKGMASFVKYINHRAGNKKHIVIHALYA